MASPLTKKNSKTHKLYQRRAGIETEIDQAVVQSDECLVARAQQHDAKSPDYLHSETLVHLHRRAVRMGKPGDVFMLALVARCEANLKGTIDNRTPQVEQLREEILSEFTVALAEDAMQGGNDMDFFECMFNSAFSTLRIDMYNHHVRLLNKTATAPADAEESVEGDIFVPASKGMPVQGAWTPPNAENLVYLREVLAFIKTMPRDEQEVLVLCRMLGWTQKRAAEHLGVDVRTIFNRLERADAKLASVKEDAL